MLLELPCGTNIHYAIQGTGPINVLLLAPGGMQSTMDKWHSHPYNPWKSLPPDKFRLIGMDQRNANDLSVGPIGSGWESYRDDQLALLNHLGIRQNCLLVGSCIGPSFALSLMQHSPERFLAAVLLQPIGLSHHTTEPGETWGGQNSGMRRSFKTWSENMIQEKRFTKEQLDILHEQMYGSDKEFCFSVTKEDVSAIKHPMLVFMGKDKSHPSQTSRDIASLAANAELIESWRDGDDDPKNVELKIENFLSEIYTEREKSVGC